MAFQLKDFVSITASMINRARATQGKVTDFNVGSVARTLMEAPAIEIEELYQRMFAGIMDAIPTAVYKGFNFPVLEAAKARGVVTVTFGLPLEVEIVVPAGTAFIAPATGLRYLSVDPVTGAVGAASVAILVEASEPGAAYNAGANAVSLASGFNFPTGSVVTSAAITSGSDGETDAERMSRFADYVRSISRGTAFSIEYGAASAKVRDGSGNVAEYVSRVGSVERPGGIDVYIYGSGTPASAELIAEAQKIVDGYYDTALGSFVPGYRPAGVDALVLPMIEQPYDLVVTVELSAGLSLTPEIESAILTQIALAFEEVHSGQTLYVEDVKSAVLLASGVAKVRLDMSENYLCPQNVVLVPGNVSIVEGAA